MSTELVEFPGTIEHTRPARRNNSIDVIALAEDYWRLAQRISNTEFVPTPLRRRPEAVLAALLSGAERGLGPMESLRSINVIEGRPNLSAEAMRALVFAAGHTIEVIETSDRKAAVTGRRAGSETSSPPFVWTIDKARRARLASKDNWVKYPESMLLARATADLCRALFPDVVAGLAVTEEVLDDITPPAETRTTRRPRTALQAPPQPVDTTAVETGKVVPPTPPPERHEAPDTGVVTPPDAGAGGPRSYRSERADMEAPPIVTPPQQTAGVVRAASQAAHQAEEDAYEDDLDDSTPWAPKPDANPADPKLGRRIHATLTEALPDLAPTERDDIRHALVAVVTRKRPDGPVSSSNDLSYEEQLALTELITKLRAGTASVTFGAIGDTIELRSHGWRYDISLRPTAVTVTRPPADPGQLPLEDE